MATAQVGERYHHYKNSEKLYTVLHIAFHTETEEELVVYQAEYDTEDLGKKPIFARPREMFEGEVVVAGDTVERFNRVS